MPITMQYENASQIIQIIQIQKFDFLFIILVLKLESKSA